MNINNLQQQLDQIEETMSQMSECIMLFKKMHHQVNQSIERIRTQLEEMNNKKFHPLRELLPSNGIDEYTHTLSKWTERSIGRILYDGKLEIDSVKQVLLNKKNILIIIGSGNNVFGSYHDRTIGMNEWCFDLNHFVFTIKNLFNIPPTKYKRTIKEKVFCITDTCLYKINGWGSIGKDSYIDYLFPSHYKDTIGIGANIFTGNIYLNTFSVDYILVLEMRQQHINNN
ncbi:hypothetical protein ENUP19_0124G0006 [Entamoeba nuttalli]|uniref:TLDc domain-containing protein n=1 Tax=Entamoeba nuttalli TaxID=412467 RepID=A0ABQ0DJ95_9EUKA